MLRYIVVITLFFVSCTAEKKTSTETDWWKETVFYQIYMPSFQDSDGDGYSDFAGMTQRLDYIESLGVKGIWLTPFLASPKVDNGYDVADYYQVDPVYGNLNDFNVFLDDAHGRGIKVIMDMVVNHTSTDCMWFQESRKSRDNPYRDFYIWRDEPNNWESFFGGVAWELDTLTNQYYYHKFDKRMADLNWTNPRVADEIQKVLRFWLDLGIDGFRLDVINFLTTDGIIADNPIENDRQVHKYDVDQPGVKDAMRLIKSTVNEYEGRFIVGEIGSDNLEILSQYQAPDLMDVVFNFNFGSIPDFNVERIFNELKNMEESMSGYPTLFFGSHDMPRLMNRLAQEDTQRAIALAALMLTAKGVPFIYYGEEIGMHNIEAETIDDIIDIQARIQYQLALERGLSKKEALNEANKHNRDRSRSPMQWNADANAGFTHGEPWLTVNKNFTEVNMESQQDQASSMLALYKALISLRNNEKVFQYGNYENLELNDGRIHFTRSLGKDTVAVIVNFSSAIDLETPESSAFFIGSLTLKTNDFLIYKY